MFILLIGFITPAVIFAIFGIIACLRRGAFIPIDNDEDKEYEILDSNIPIRVEVPKPYYFGLHFPPVGYQNFFPAPTVGMPPSYSEATSIPHMTADRKSRRSSAESQSSVSSSSKTESRHLPRNAPKIRPVPSPHITIQMDNCPMTF